MMCTSFPKKMLHPWNVEGIVVLIWLKCLSEMIVMKSHSKHENVVIMYSASCWWKVGHQNAPKPCCSILKTMEVEWGLVSKLKNKSKISSLVKHNPILWKPRDPNLIIKALDTLSMLFTLFRWGVCTNVFSSAATIRNFELQEWSK